MDVAMLNEISDEVKKYNARLLPVIKGRKTEEISKVYNEGFREFGENRLEELLDHKSNFKDCHFHFIAPLQSRKIPEVLENSKSFDCFASWRRFPRRWEGFLTSPPQPYPLPLNCLILRIFDPSFSHMKPIRGKN